MDGLSFHGTRRQVRILERKEFLRDGPWRPYIAESPKIHNLLLQGQPPGKLFVALSGQQLKQSIKRIYGIHIPISPIAAALFR